MPRRITVECEDGHREEIIIGVEDKIKRCPRELHGFGEDLYNTVGICKKKREIVWDEPGPQGAPAFRVQGMSKKF